MGFIFHKSIKILPGVRLNFGKRGISFTFGSKGIGYRTGSTGKRKKRK